jgi:hypothetical protein
MIRKGVLVFMDDVLIYINSLESIFCISTKCLKSYKNINFLGKSPNVCLLSDGLSTWAI